MTNTDPLLTPGEAGEYLRRPVGTLQQWRYRGVGPRYSKQLGRVLYRLSDLDAWIDAHAIEPQAAAR